ncbi:MAG TPA: AHH domain-containing protein, partial [Phycisphaerales bacterium]|nr:AHH domain-containing protein [Phycisphaerales bacterium]
TNKHWKAGRQWSKDLSRVFKQAGLSMNNKANLLEMAKELHNKGKHSFKYHEMVLDKLRSAVGGLTGPEAQLALKNALEEIKDIVRRDPGIIYRQ